MRYEVEKERKVDTQLSLIKELIITEKFRQVLIREGIADDYILGYDVSSSVSGMIVCFKTLQNLWEVYEVDETAEHYGRKKHASQIQAFEDAAMRRNYQISPNELSIVNNFYNTSLLIMAEKSSVDSALDFLQKFSSFYANTAAGNKAHEDYLKLKKATTTANKLKPNFGNRRNYNDLTKLLNLLSAPPIMSCDSKPDIVISPRKKKTEQSTNQPDVIILQPTTKEDGSNYNTVKIQINGVNRDYRSRIPPVKPNKSFKVSGASKQIKRDKLS